jgi:hypothetical protein
MKAEKSGVGLLNDIERWQTRAKETRMVAETMHGGVARDALLQVANDWEQMAPRRLRSHSAVSRLTTGIRFRQPGSRLSMPRRSTQA